MSALTGSGDADSDRVFSREVCLEAELAVERELANRAVAERNRLAAALVAAGVAPELVTVIAKGESEVSE